MENEEKTTREKNVVHTFREGRLWCDVIEEQSSEGTFYSTEVFRWYKSGDVFKKSHRFTTGEKGNDLAAAVQLCANANNWIQTQRGA